jgi:predicted DNA-binding transcriptional regulator
MNIFSAMVAVAAIFGIVAVARYWFESRRSAPADDDRIERLEEEFRERIETLERIVTDQREELRKKIDDL